ncbi:carboxylic ester hydrolase-like [Oppia nitens]|uniref:carboxylic ester hydrolase-like n=1 Tax=Oppia nitens TaxID=1686743 RepID=UPI0023DA2827|nr:carboxylic ester hydrolase-like [Oppia nitens]
MVYIHGGEFQFGGKDFYGPQYLLDHDVILVTINYRLGVLGFMSTGDDFCPGNFGIHDQIEALKWISYNIQAFDGNPYNVTVFGHDSGAISVSILLTASRSWGLFHNVMILSGSVFTPNAIKIPDIKTSIDFSQVLNCDLKYSSIDQNIERISQPLVECLRSKSIEDLMFASRLPGLYPNEFQYTFGPVLDKNVSTSILPDLPIRLFLSGNYWKTPMVAGLTLNEGSLDFYTHYDKIRDWSFDEKAYYLYNKYKYNEFYAKVLTKSVEWYYFKRFNDTIYTPNPYYNINRFNQIGVQIKPYLKQNKNQELFEKEKQDITLIESIGDFMYGSANTLLLDIHSKNTEQTYLYVVEHRGLKTFGTLQHKGSQNIHRNQYGVSHMDDIFYLFPTLYNDNNTSTYDEPVIRTMCQFFAHFARFGRFGQYTPVFGINWIQYSTINPNYLRILSLNTQMSKGFRSDFLSFWNYFIREVFDDFYAKKQNDSQISAQFVGTVQLRGMIKFGHNKFLIN